MWPTPRMDHWGCVRNIFMGCYTDGCLWVVTILVGHRDSLVGVGLIGSHRYCCMAEGSVRVLQCHWGVCGYRYQYRGLPHWSGSHICLYNHTHNASLTCAFNMIAHYMRRGVLKHYDWIWHSKLNRILGMIEVCWFQFLKKILFIQRQWPLHVFWKWSSCRRWHSALYPKPRHFHHNWD